MKFLWEKFKAYKEWLLVSFPNKYHGLVLFLILVAFLLISACGYPKFNVTLDKLNLDGNDWGENGKIKLHWTFPALNKELNESPTIVEEIVE